MFSTERDIVGIILMVHHQVKGPQDGSIEDPRWKYKCSLGYVCDFHDRVYVYVCLGCRNVSFYTN